MTADVRRDVRARWKWAAITAVIAVGLVAGGYGFYRVEAQRIRLYKYEELAAIGELKADQIAQWRQERLGNARNSAESPFFAKGVAAFLKDPGLVVQRDEFRRRLDLERRTENYADALLLDLEGRILLAATDNPAPVGAITMKAVTLALAGEQAVFSDLFRSTEGAVYLDAVAVVTDSNGRPIAVVVLRSDAEKVLFPIVQSWPIPSRTAETLLIQRDGGDILFLNELRHRAGTALSFRIPLSRRDLPGVQAVEGKLGRFEGRDYRGVDVLADLRRIPGSPWLMVAKVDASEILAETNARAGVIAAFVLLLLLLTAAVVASLYRQQQARLYGDLYASELKARQARDLLLESEALYRSILNASPDNITVSDMEGRIRLVSPTALTMFGCQRAEDMVGRLLVDFFVPVDRDRAISNLALRYQGVFTGPIEYRAIRADGRSFDVEVNGECIRAEDGKPTGMVSIIRDTTDRKRMEVVHERLEAQNRQLQKSESLGRMAGAIAHHFNNQLHAVMGNLELAIEDLPPGVAQPDSLTEAMRAAHRAAEVSELMLVYLGQTSGKRAPLDLSDACRRGLPLIRAAIPKDVGLKTGLPTPGPIISANANQLQQVLTNLVTNAWEAIGRGRGAVQLSVGTVPAAEIPAAPRFPVDWQPQDPAYGCLTVEDVGCGIAAGDIEQIFDPFYSTKFTGRGLGLPVVLGIVRAHGGAVTVASEPGRGSVFRVFLPMAAQATSPRDETPAKKATDVMAGGTVLLVDDEPALRALGTLMLSRLGFEVLEAEDGGEAAAMFRQHQDDIRCVVCDLTMPRMNGWDTLAALRAIAPAVPVVLASGYDEASVMAGDHPAWPNAFLGKPYQLKQLREAIGQAMAAADAGGSVEKPVSS